MVNENKAPDIGNNVVVVGGGNVALDVARTARRCGAENVTIVYRRSESEMPADKAEIEEALEEGVRFEFLSAPVAVLGEQSATALKIEKMTLGEPDEKGRRKPVGTGEFSELSADSVIAAVGQTVDWGGLDTGMLQKSIKNLAFADSFTYQTAQPDIFVAGDVFTGPKFAIDAIAGGKQAAISLHRYAWGHNLVTGRDRHEYKFIDKDNVGACSYDTAGRQTPPVDISKKLSMRDERGVFTEEQVKAETARCLKCGAAHVDENQCIGCGVCTTRCKFDAITLYKKYNEVSVANEELMKDIGKEVMRRIDSAYEGKPLMKNVVKMVVKQKVKPKKLKAAKPRKW